MKYANQLTEEELKELFQLFTDSNATIKEMIVTRDDRSIGIEGVIAFPEFEEEILKENPDAVIITDDDYEITDFEVYVMHHSGNCTPDYRKWMYKKFGNDYARDYLLGYSKET